MPLPPRPGQGQTGWDTYLDAVIDSYQTRIAALENAASSALHATKIGQVSKSGSVTITAGTVGALSLVGGSIVTGDDYWGSPNTALPLAVSISAGGTVVLPDDDATYDLNVTAAANCNVADAGQLVGILCAGNDSSGSSFLPAPVGASPVPLSLFMTTRVFAGDGPFTGVALSIDATHMTHDVTATFFQVIAAKR